MRVFLIVVRYHLDILGQRGLSLSKVIGFDRLNQLRRAFLRRYGFLIVARVLTAFLF